MNGKDDDDDDGVPPVFMPSTLPFVAGSETSKAAAQSMRKRAASDAARVYTLIEKAGADGMTDKEIEVALGMSHESASARRNGLVRKGLVKDSGNKRLSPSKHEVIVWIIGKGVPVEGSKNRRGSRPTDETIRAAVANVRAMIDLTSRPGEELTALLEWLERTARVNRTTK